MIEKILPGRRRLMKGMPLVFLSDIMREQMVRERSLDGGRSEKTDKK